MHLEVSSFDDDLHPVVIDFHDSTATIADQCLIIIDSRDNETLIAGFNKDMWSTFRVVDE